MKYLYPTLFLAAFTAGACDRKNELDLPKTASGEVSKDGAVWSDALASQAVQQRAEFMTRAGHDKAVLNAKIGALKRAAAVASGRAKSDLEGQIVLLEQEQKIADQTFAEMRSAAGEKWQVLKVAMSASMGRLNHSLEKMQAENSN